MDIFYDPKWECPIADQKQQDSRERKSFDFVQELNIDPDEMLKSKERGAERWVMLGASASPIRLCACYIYADIPSNWGDLLEIFGKQAN